MATIYIASITAHAEKWKALADAYPQHEFTSSWVHQIGKVPDAPEFAPIFWMKNLHDIMGSSFLIVYAEPQDHLRGSIFEAGAAVTNNVRVIVVGQHPHFGTWQYLPGILHAKDMTTALWTVGLLEGSLSGNDLIIT